MASATTRRVPVAAIAVFLLSISLSGLASHGAEASGALEPYLTGLDWPVALAFASDGRIFFSEAFTGRIRIIENGTLLPTPFYKLHDAATDFERGVLGLTLDPRFPALPWMYAYYTLNDTANGTVHNRIVRIRANGDSGAFQDVLLDRIPAGEWHNGGPIAFGPDGKLYALAGDAENRTLIPTTYPQDLLSLAGKVLRMNPDGTVPTDNPFYGNSSANPYIYTYGHRNMFGLAFHPATGKVYITENGPDCNDEVNLLIPGRNHGWGPNETCSEPPPPPYNTNQDGPNPVLPLVWYTPTIAPTNAIIYSGPNFTSFQGDLIFGDFNTGSLRHLDLEPPDYDRVVNQSVILQVPEGILDVEEGPDGAIWFTTQSTLYRFVDTSPHPRASFTATPNPVDVGVPVTFNASASSDASGTIVSYAWEFGDGAKGSGIVAVHAYAAKGTYTVALTVVDNDGFSDTALGEVRINQPPSASFIVSPSPGYIGVRVAFDARASSDPDGVIVSYAWTFGDGSSAVGEEVTHTYAAKGTFTLTLTVTDDLGATARASGPVVIGDRVPSIVSTSPALEAFALEAGQQQTFSVNATDPDGDSLTYVWTVNGAVAGAGSRSFEFSEPTPGTYVINVTVSDGSLETSYEWTVTVRAPLVEAGSFYAWAIGGILATAIVGMAVFLTWRRIRRRRKAVGKFGR